MTKDGPTLYPCPIAGCDSEAYWKHFYFDLADGSASLGYERGRGEWRGNFMCLKDKEHIGRTTASPSIAKAR